MSNRKKFVAAALSAVMAVAFTVTPAFAQSVAELQAQIAALLAQINALQAQLQAQTGGGASVSCSFTRDLTVGSTGDDVKCLQQYLNGAGYKIAASGPGSPGNESTYFGQLTKAAVAKWQAANGISPASGYFGPISRSKYASLAGAGAPSAPSAPGAPSAPASGLAASLAPDSPSGSAIAGAGQIDSLKFRLTAGAAGGVTVTEMKFTKIGVVSDTAISNLYLADESGNIVAQFTSLNQGVATFSNLNLAVNAGATRTFTLRTDLSTAASAGNTLAWRLDSVTAGSATVTGTPVSGNTLTVTTVSNPALASATLTFNAVGSSVDAGTTGVQVANISANVNNSPVDLKNIKFTVVGTANMSDLRNLKLKVNGTEVASLASVASDGSAAFVLSTPARLNTGNSTIELYADVMGSPNRRVTFTILRPYDVSVVDTQYNTGISPSVNTSAANEIAINNGQITVSLATDTPTGNIPKGASNVTLAKFNIYAAGEPVKVKFLQLRIDANSGSDWDGSTLAQYTEDINNIKLVDDAGNQVGSTISEITIGPGNGQCSLGSNTLTCNFGTSSSVINYIVPANTTRVLSAKVDIKSTNDVTSLRARLPAQTSNLEGQISFQSANSGAADGAVLTVVTNPLTVAANASVGTQTFVAGANNVRIASFVVSASSAEGAKISTLTFDKDSDTDAMDIQNVKVMVGSTQFGATRPTVADGGVTMSFSGTPITVPAGGSVTIDVYADILTSSTAGGPPYASVIDLTGWSALGSVSNSAITFPGAVNGQSVTLSSGPTLTVAQDSETPPAKFVVMGSTGVSLFKVRLTADNVEDIKITDITFRDTFTGTAGVASLSNLELYDSGTKVAGPLPLSVPSGATTGTVTFSPSSPIVVAKNTSKTIEVRASVPTFDAGAVSGSGHVLSIPTTGSVVALGKDSNQPATVSGTPSSNTSTVARTKLTLASSLLGASSGRTRSAVDDIATITFTADAGYQVTVNTVSLKFQGLAVSNGTAFTVDLIDANTNAAWGSSAQANVTSGAGNSATATFSPQAIVSAGSSKQVKVRVNSSSFFNQSQTADSLSVTVNAAGDLTWSDGTTNFNLETTLVPFTVVNVSYE
jgi:hypothetical protein